MAIKLLYSLFILILLFPQYALAGKKIALVIGNSEYQVAPLKNPVHDANLIAQTLTSLDFTVLKYINADQKTIKKAIRAFGDKLEEAGRDSIGLFYYSGHGVQNNGINYIIPVGATIRRESDVEIEAVAASAVMATLDYARNRLNFVIMDACRNNPFASSFRSGIRGLARMDAPAGTLVAYSTSPGNVAQDGDGTNSPYTLALASGMQNPGLPVEQMFKIVRRKVLQATENKQRPWESSSLTGDFSFKSRNADDSPDIVAPVSQGETDREALFWESVKDSTAKEDYEEYLRQFPGGLFATIALNRIKSHSDTVPPPEVTTPPSAKPAAAAGTSEMPLPSVQPESASRAITYTEQEKNNTFGSANLVSVNSLITGRISPKGDSDWYRIAVRHQGRLELTVSNVAPQLDVAIRIWDAEKHTYSSWISPPRKGAETTGFVDFKHPGTYLVEVRDSHDDESSEQNYHLSLLFTPGRDGFEPNDSFGRAVKVVPGKTWKATILPKGDADWYQLTVNQQGELKVSVTDVPENLDVVIRVWNSHKHTISGWITPFKAGGDTELSFDLPAAGTYMLEMRDGRDDAASILPLTITMRFRPSLDPFELNNDFGSSADLAIGETVKATILPKGDSDWYRLQFDEQGRLNVSVTNVPAALDLHYRLWDLEKHTITGWFAPLKAGAENINPIDIQFPGEYVLEIRDGRDDSRSIEPYTLDLQYVPTRDRSEPNNSFGTASPLKLGTAIQATIFPKKDSDWYRIYIHRPGDLQVRISQVAPELDLHVRAWDAEKHTISNWVAPLRAGGETMGTISLPKPGEYILEVRDGRDDNASIIPYRLEIRM